MIKIAIIQFTLINNIWRLLYSPWSAAGTLLLHNTYERLRGLKGFVLLWLHPTIGLDYCIGFVGRIGAWPVRSWLSERGRRDVISNSVRT